MNAADDLFDLELAAEHLAEYRRQAELARLTRRAAAGPGRSLRGHVAAVLAVFATWLDPQTAWTGAHRPAQLSRARRAG